MPFYKQMLSKPYELADLESVDQELFPKSWMDAVSLLRFKYGQSKMLCPSWSSC